LGNQFVPEMQGKVGIDATEPSNKVILPGSDGPFSGVASVNGRGDQLEVDIDVRHELFQDFGALVVEALELGFQASAHESRMQRFVGVEDGFGFPIFEWLDKYMDAVKVVQYHHVIVVSARWDDESAGLVGMDLAGDFLDRTVTLMGSLCGRRRKGVVILGSRCQRLVGFDCFFVEFGWLLLRKVRIWNLVSAKQMGKAQTDGARTYLCLLSQKRSYQRSQKGVTQK
jgi:hypothetical protein